MLLSNVCYLQLLSLLFYLLSFLLLGCHKLFCPLHFHLNRKQMSYFSNYFTGVNLCCNFTFTKTAKSAFKQTNAKKKKMSVVPACSCEQYLGGSQALGSQGSRFLSRPRIDKKINWNFVKTNCLCHQPLQACLCWSSHWF